MAKRAENQRGTEFIALPAGTIEDGELLGDELTDEESAFNEFRVGFGSEKMGELRVGKLKLGKDGAPIATSKSAHCFSCAVDRYSFSELLEYIRENYGAGVFRIIGIESGRKGVVFNKLIEIAESVSPKAPASETPLQNPANVFESAAKIMAESAARTEALIARLSESRQAAPVLDPMDMMTKMAGLFSSIMGVAPRPAAAASDDLLGQLEKLAKIKDLLGGFGGGGGDDKESNFYDVVKAGLTSFGPALAALAVRGAQQSQTPALSQPDQVVIPATRPAPGNYDKPGPTRQTVSQGDPAMKKQIDVLVQNAKMGVSPSMLAQTILDMTPDEKIDDLGAMLDDPQMIDKMAQLNPEVSTFRDFFDKLRTALLALLDEGEADTLPPDQAPAQGSADDSGAATT